AVNSVTAGLRANVYDWISDAGCAAEENLVVLENPQREHVHQRISVVARLKNAFAADRWHAEAVAVVRDAFDDAFENPAVAIPVLGIIQRPESNGVQYSDGPRAH